VTVPEAFLRHVSSRLVLDVHQPVTAVLKVAAAGGPGAAVEERLDVTCDGIPLRPAEAVVPGEGRTHLLAVQPGRVTVEYTATVTGRAAPPLVTDADRITYLRPSRYAESDRLLQLAAAEFAGVTGPADLLTAVSSWVGTRLSYVPGAGRPTDGAVDTLLSGQGVCRDYAHLVIALLRALDVPARYVSAYAPGLSPMDFHAVAEAAVDGRWQAADATLRAPRTALVRIGAGRDAADTAFLSLYGGAADLRETEVAAVVDGVLPADDLTVPASIV
jgi:transglutaminase-like putative cysteine protease